MSRNVLTYSKSSFPCIFLLAGIFPPGVLVWEVSHWLFCILVHPLSVKVKSLFFQPWIEREYCPPSTVTVTPRTILVIASLPPYQSLPDPYLSLPDLIG